MRRNLQTRHILKAVDEDTEDVGNGWSRPYAVFAVVAFRSGWKGAWDAIKAAWRKDIRLQLPTNLSVSLYIKDASDDPIYVFGAQVETLPGGSNAND